MVNLNKVLVTGATGFLGHRVVKTLVANSAVQTLVTNGRNRQRGQALSALGTRFMAGDLRDTDFVAHLTRDITAIIHCAALSSAWGAYSAFYEQNCLVTQHLLDAAVTNGISRFIYISSPSVYATLSDRFLVQEDAPLPHSFLNAYAQTKYQAEQRVIHQLTANQIPYVILRPRAIVGAGDTVIVPRLLKAQSQNKLFIIGNGRNYADFTSVSNAANAILLALTADEDATNQIYNITNGEAQLLWPQLEQFFQRLQRSFTPRILPYPLALGLATIQEKVALITQREPALTRYTLSLLAHSMTLDITKAQTRLGYAPKQTTAQAIEEFVDWFKSGAE